MAGGVRTVLGGARGGSSQACQSGRGVNSWRCNISTGTVGV